jgi:anti-sigma factor RsiW
MTECKRDHGNRNLAMALAPGEFPRYAAEIEDHVGTCESCREELNALKALDAFLREHKDELSDVMSDCPTPDQLVKFASGEQPEESVAAHLECCPDCREQVELVRDLYRLDPSEGDPQAHSAQKAAVRRAVSRVCGSQEKTASISLGGLLHRIRELLHVPSLALGAVAAALLVVVLLPRGPQEQRVIPVFSDVGWNVPPPRFVGKSLFESEKTANTKKKVALVLLVSGTGGPTGTEVEGIYRKVDLMEKLSGSFDFMAPEKVKTAAAMRVGPGNIEKLTGSLREALPVDYLLLFRISESKGQYDLTGKLVTKDINGPQIGAFRSGVVKEGLASRIGLMGADLLGQVARP